jgi:hypothetical protein
VKPEAAQMEMPLTTAAARRPFIWREARRRAGVVGAGVRSVVMIYLLCPIEDASSPSTRRRSLRTEK